MCKSGSVPENCVYPVSYQTLIQHFLRLFNNLLYNSEPDQFYWKGSAVVSFLPRGKLVSDDMWRMHICCMQTIHWCPSGLSAHSSSVSLYSHSILCILIFGLRYTYDTENIFCFQSLSREVATSTIGNHTSWVELEGRGRCSKITTRASWVKLWFYCCWTMLVTVKSVYLCIHCFLRKTDFTIKCTNSVRKTTFKGFYFVGHHSYL